MNDEERPNWYVVLKITTLGILIVVAGNMVTLAVVAAMSYYHGGRILIEQH